MRFSLAAFNQGAKKANQLPAETPTEHHGYRTLSSMLYTLTNGQEVAAPMAALHIRRASPFWFSHDAAHVNLGKVIYTHDDTEEVSVSRPHDPDSNSSPRISSAKSYYGSIGDGKTSSRRSIS